MNSDTTPPDFGAARDDVAALLVQFARTLRAEGATVPTDAVIDAVGALAVVGLDDRDRCRAALRTTLLSDRSEADSFESQFPAFWYRMRRRLEAAARGDLDAEIHHESTAPFAVVTDRGPDPEADADPKAGDPSDSDGRDLDAERSQRRALAEASDPAAEGTADDGSATAVYGARGGGEPVDAAGVPVLEGAAIRRFRRALAEHPGRRWSDGLGAGVNARRAFRRSLATGGAVVDLPERDSKPTVLRCCVLVDVSRSVLDILDREFLLAVLDGLHRGGRATRSFFFDTEIREVTDAFEDAREGPLAALERAELEWGGGTRIGDALTTLRRRYPTAVDRRRVTLVVSDGLDVGETERLERGMAWLSGRSAAVLWLNPLAGSAEYEPTCSGMATALPYVDGLFAFADTGDLTEIARQLERRGLHGPLGYEYDPERTAARTAERTARRPMNTDTRVKQDEP